MIGNMYNHCCARKCLTVAQGEVGSLMFSICQFSLNTPTVAYFELTTGYQLQNSCKFNNQFSQLA